ncbi:prepilin peptidase CpaA [Paraburkholderia bannensis]|uniref:Prepilin peptidase CpaA n=1 Tax=Paraburkholderia bannensis TaxID=765414 RepID=A0A7W9U055_9BURK|nr:MULTISPECIES: prepilin peptidase [Paraburkholderia]MBB3259568.1 prepilin peptidase CpaA [Paraburkholderia sp. WP4_3_2]MBB6104584.1 prepilin peptidase CpaA [Paraburkholderia bannensis]
MAARPYAMTSLIFSLTFAAWALAVAVCDCRSRRVPNTLVGAGLCAALAASLVNASPAHHGVLPALAAAAAGLAALMPFFVLGMMGAGDVKVFAVLGAWCGMQPLLDLWIVASIAALVHVVVRMLVMRSRSHALSGRRISNVTSGGWRGTPYAACLTLPALVWLAFQCVPGGLQ